MTTCHFSTVNTSDGPFTIIVSGDAVLASGWTANVDELVALIHPAMRPAVGDIAAESDYPVMEAARAAVVAHYDGQVDAPRAIPVHQQSGPFRQQAWDVLRSVVPGEPITYTEFAVRAGRPTAVRAAASACAQNAAALFVPCHRILRSDGSLGGFRYGLDIKRALLDREARMVSDPDPAPTTRPLSR